eukprot:CAMPEP_0171933024 /NCGR_PEP_ID=MMETSP0993-20121228/30885_1 /TAXON_ID=483369 /ORGANISM="non described non described, Strain CCMP2098" /LENGTH=41 /DNA_ID= /DNA_START= /DNA_END= /DNA_ORIENTATION=
MPCIGAGVAVIPTVDGMSEIATASVGGGIAVVVVVAGGTGK